jgi:hypothetical protein
VGAVLPARRNNYRKGVGYLLYDANDPNWAADLADRIKSFHGDGNSVIPGMGPYNLVGDDCGEAFARALTSMKLPAK